MNIFYIISDNLEESEHSVPNSNLAGKEDSFFNKKINQLGLCELISYFKHEN